MKIPSHQRWFLCCCFIVAFQHAQDGRLLCAQAQAINDTATNNEGDGVAWDNNETSLDLLSTRDLPRCDLDTVELLSVGKGDMVDPCILFDIRPQIQVSESNTTSILTVVGVFDAASGDHRDGAVVATEHLNQDNDGKGAAVGYYRDHFVQIRLVIAVSGNSRNMSPLEYEAAHKKMLESLLVDLSPHYIIGTASFHASFEKDLAGKYQTMLLAQVGPQRFYEKGSNDHIFGVHIPSENYGIPAFQAVRFAAESRAVRHKQKLRIVYRDRSEFFYSTCRHIYDKALEEGLENIDAIEYNPEADHDGDGILNQDDEDFLNELADRACSPEEAGDEVAIWGCFLSAFETNTFLERLGENACRPASIWLTVASWSWAEDYSEYRPYLQSGAQWHRSMAYSDEYFTNGQAMIEHAKRRFGHHNLPAYGIMGSYHAIYLMYHNIRSFFKAKDVPQVEEGLKNRYEEIRRSLLDLSLAKTLYGPTSFDANRRNIGRGSAGLQWLQSSNPLSAINGTVPYLGTDEEQGKIASSTQNLSGTDYEMLLVSPIDQATAFVAYPAPAALQCEGGEFINETKSSSQPAILINKCSLCPVDTFSESTNFDLKCGVCVQGSTTEGENAARSCKLYEDHLLPAGLKTFGLALMSLVFSIALACMGWTIVHRNDPVVQLSQVEFLLLICIGSLISSSSIIPLSVQSGTFEDDSASCRACTALPWLYTTGWMLQYGGISVKSYRMYGLMKAQSQMKRVEIRARRMMVSVLLLLLVNYAVLIPWTIIDPLTWERKEIAELLNRNEGFEMHESIGRCNSENFFAWVAPLLGLQFAILVGTNIILWRIRGISDRYQESKYFIMASVYIFEILVVGVPILIAVRESTEASYIVLTCIVCLSDLGILLMIFLPKISFQRKGLPVGMSVGDSIVKRKGSSLLNLAEIRKAAHTFACGPNEKLDSAYFRQNVSTLDPNRIVDGTESKTSEEQGVVAPRVGSQSEEIVFERDSESQEQHTSDS